jgi:hypothetical protein
MPRASSVRTEGATQDKEKRGLRSEAGAASALSTTHINSESAVASLGIAHQVATSYWRPQQRCWHQFSGEL